MKSLTQHVTNQTFYEESPVSSTFERKGGEIGKASTCLEYADIGTGDYRSPSFIISSPSGMSISPIRYKSHRIVRGKSQLPEHLPGIRCQEKDATTLIVTMSDELSGLEVDLYYVCLHNFDAVCRRTVIRNLHNRECIDYLLIWENAQSN